MADESGLLKVLENIGKGLGFDVRKEVEASESAYVDMVWFDSRLAVGERSTNMRYAPVLPIVAFEVELHTGLNAKHVKGSVSNLSNLGAQLSVIVLGNGNIEALKNQSAHKDESDEERKQILRDRVYRWIYAEAQPRGRIIMLFENEVRAWAEKLKLLASPVTVS